MFQKVGVHQFVFGLMAKYKPYMRTNPKNIGKINFNDKVKSVSGHVLFYYLKNIIKKYKHIRIISFVRDPIDLIFSLYHHEEVHSNVYKYIKTESAFEFVRTNCNLLTRYYSGNSYCKCSTNNMNTRRNCTLSDANDAIHNIKSGKFEIGETTKMDRMAKIS